MTGGDVVPLGKEGVTAMHKCLIGLIPAKRGRSVGGGVGLLGEGEGGEMGGSGRG